jgi:peptidoglycan biosynthesis protein MviN/MurJ (putative lipid II flippase)
MALLSILGVLFISLFVLVFFSEKFGKQDSEASLSKITRWIFPLILLLMLLQGLRYIL